jgi:hypothetical protein
VISQRSEAPSCACVWALADDTQFRVGRTTFLRLARIRVSPILPSCRRVAHASSGYRAETQISSEQLWSQLSTAALIDRTSQHATRNPLNMAVSLIRVVMLSLVSAETVLLGNGQER